MLTDGGEHKFHSLQRKAPQAASSLLLPVLILVELVAVQWPSGCLFHVLPQNQWNK